MNPNGTFQRDGKWWVEAKPSTGKPGEFGPFESEDEADSAASYVFAIFTLDGELPPREAVLLAPRDEVGAEAARSAYRALRGFTKEFHRAKIGTMEPALCGEPAPGRPWRAAPQDGTAAALPPCELCRAKHGSGDRARFDVAGVVMPDAVTFPKTTISIASGNGSLTVQDNGGDTVAVAEARRERWITYRRALSRG